MTTDSAGAFPFGPDPTFPLEGFLPEPPPDRFVREPAREVPVLAECDVAVFGGGTTGVCAAAAAARESKRIVLVERYGFLGGMATAANIIAQGTYPVDIHSPDRAGISFSYELDLITAPARGMTSRERIYQSLRVSPGTLVDGRAVARRWDRLAGFAGGVQPGSSQPVRRCVSPDTNRRRDRAGLRGQP